MSDTTCDAFLGGRVQILQPRHGYRAATDPVFLAAACPAAAGDRVLELGCGVGVASLCLAARVPGLRLLGVERQGAYAALARANAAAAGVDFSVVEADLTRLPPEVRQQSFDHVLANPPYFATGDRQPRRACAAHPDAEARQSPRKGRRWPIGSRGGAGAAL